MTTTARTRPGSALFRIDHECDQFEKDWRSGNRPPIDTALARLPTEGQQIGFRELLTIELELRLEAGEPISREDYIHRFTGFTAIIDELLNSISSRFEATQPLSPSDTQPASATTCTRYLDLRPFRRGGLGTLYRALDESLHRETVVKFMNDQCEKDPSLLAQFKVEAEVTSRLDHPGIVPVYGIGQDWHGRPFYVMRLINGRELKQAIQEYHQGGGSRLGGRANRHTLFTLLEHLASACNTVAYAHHVGVVHCDLKPANIMIGKYGETFVLDWGLATNFERTTTFFSSHEPTMRPHSASSGSTSGQRGGTYGYISPEQLLSDGPIGPTSDVYSLGATLYEILTGQPPFDGRDTDIRDKIRRGQFTPPRQLHTGICKKLEAICLKAMSLAPQSRYTTAKLLAGDLTSWMRDEELQAVPDRCYDRLTRVARRHGGITAALFLTIITVLVAAALTDRTIKIAAHEKQVREVTERTSQENERVVTMALDAFEAISRPFANGEMNNLGVFRPVVDEIKNFTALYLEGSQDTPSMQLHTARVYELRSIVSHIIARNPEQAIADLQKAEKLYSAPSSAADKLERDLRLAQNHISQGRLFIQRDELDRALAVLTSAATSLEQLQKSQPVNNVLQRHLAEAYHCTGEVHLNRRTEGAARRQALLEAEDKFNQGKNIRENLVKNSVGEERRNHERDLARSWGYLGDVYRYQGAVAQAGQAYEESKRLRERLYSNKPGDPEHRFQFARGLGNFGELERGYRGNLKNAIVQLSQAERIQRDLTDDFQDVVNFWIDLAGTESTLAEIYLFAAQDDPSQATEQLKLARNAAQQAIKIYSSLLRQNVPGAARGLAQCSIALAILDRDFSPSDSEQHIHDAETFVAKLGSEAELSSSEMVTVAMLRSLQGRPEVALQALGEAVERGENTAFRFEQHQNLGFKAIAEDPKFGPELKALLKTVRESLTTQ
jgi:serine/threonine-protein kinase